MSEPKIEFAFNQRIKKLPEFNVLNQGQQESILQILKDSDTSEKHHRLLNNLNLPNLLIDTVYHLKNLSSILTRISKDPIDFDEIQFFFKLLSSNLDEFTIGELQKAVLLMLFMQKSIEKICKCCEFLRIFEGTPLKEWTDAYIFISVMSLLGTSGSYSINTLTDCLIYLSRVKGDYLTISVIYDNIQKEFISQCNENNTNPNGENEAYLALQDKILQESDLNSDFEPEIIKCINFRVMSLDAKKIILEILRDPDNFEEGFQRFNKLNLPESLKLKVHKSRLLNKLSQEIIDFSIIQMLFTQISGHLDQYTIDELQKAIHSLLINAMSIEIICKYTEFLRIFHGTPLEKYTDELLLKKIQSLLEIEETCDMLLIAGYCMKLKSLKQSSPSMSKYFENLKAILLEGLKRDTEISGEITEAYSLLLKNNIEESELKRVSEYCIKMQRLSYPNISYKQHFEIIKDKLIEEATSSVEIPEWAKESFLELQSDITQDTIGIQPPAVEHCDAINSRNQLEITDIIFPKVINRIPKPTPSVIVEGARTLLPIRVRNKERKRDAAVKTTICSEKAKISNFEGKYLKMLNTKGCKNIVKMYGMFEDVIENGYSITLVMERSTMSLYDDIKAWPKKPVEERKVSERERERERERQALEVLNQISLAMSELSKHNLWHRDIKPANILIFLKTVTRDGIEQTIKKFKLSDFNISHEYLRSVNGATRPVPAKEMHATTEFAAPEIVGVDSYKAKFSPIEELTINFNLSDIYSLGLTVLRMLTNKDKKCWNNKLSTLQSRMDNLIGSIVQSDILKKILLKMIRVNAKERLTILELRKYFIPD